MSGSTKKARHLASRVRRFGCTDLVSLEGGLTDPAQLDYLDLLPKGRAKQAPSPVVAVAEHQGVALLYLIDDLEGEMSREELANVQQVLANRSDPAWLGVVKPGSLEVFPIGFHSVNRELRQIEVIDASSPEAPLFFQSLAHGTFSGNRRAKSSDYVFRKIFSLLSKTSEAFVPERILEPLDVLSMAGRSLFFRFLVDRRIVLPEELGEICPRTSDIKDVFSSAERAAHTSVWLDSTFNGDFLSLISEEIPVEDEVNRLKAYRAFYREANANTEGLIFDHLTAILKGWEVVGDALQSELDWGDLDFAHIPVGVLSQVYESFSHLDDPDKAQRDSVHYTPRIIAELMVDQAFSASRDPATACTLDPACGAGIFLVLAFRRLVSERWLHDEERPNYRVIQSILYKQLRGFDISESALRLAALSLYITAIELNASPRPPKSLKFPKNLRNSVLYNFEDEEGQLKLGSLRDEVAEKFRGQFDIVIGNPPWTRLREPESQSSESATEQRRKSKETAESERVNNEYTRIGREVLKARGLEDLAREFENPDKNPDLPFVWRATEWAKEDGIIALAMPARIFQRAGGKGAVAWEALLRCVSLTGILNGANLRKTGVWREVDFPWCVFFAKNSNSRLGHRFRFSAPVYDNDLHQHARFGIDYEAAASVSVEETLKRPWLLKTLSIGTHRDVEIMDQIVNAFPQTLGDVWNEWDSKGDRTGKGYDLSPNLKPKPAPFLVDLPDFVRPESAFSIDEIEFPTFFENHGRESAYWPKTEVLYEPPLVVIPKSPGESRFTAKAFRSDKKLAFSQINYGYSAAGHPDSDLLLGLIYLLANSSLFSFFALMRSSSQGADRMMFVKGDFDALPFPEPESVGKRARNEILKLADQLEDEKEKPWEKIDQCLFRLYGLDESSVQAAKDTLFASAYYRKEGREALVPPTQELRSTFASELRKLLQPFFSVCGLSLTVREPEFQQDVWREPWFFLSLEADGEKAEAIVPPKLLEAAMKQANETGSTRVIVRRPRQKGLLLGVLSQRRWWTITRARMCGRHILREHLGAFGIEDGGGVD